MSALVVTELVVNSAVSVYLWNPGGTFRSTKLIGTLKNSPAAMGEDRVLPITAVSRMTLNKTSGVPNVDLKPTEPNKTTFVLLVKVVIPKSATEMGVSDTLLLIESLKFVGTLD
ncbi:hypothetical protein [Alteribacillus bidgolensis]|uniref:hypothetical protein n=1 Tax=Alteribacillus bidgolensis TaxID=930129 RepID=UPI0011137F39|nr:hypothetical protein [Alteribacillus bidgolensis]